MLMKYMEIFLTLLYFFTVGSRSELNSIVILCSMIITLSVDLLFWGKSSIIVSMFILSFLSGVVILMCFTIKMCNVTGFNPSVGGSGMVNIYFLIMILFIATSLIASGLLHKFLPYNEINCLITPESTLKFESNLLSYLIIVVMLLLLLFMVEALISPLSVKFITL